MDLARPLRAVFDELAAGLKRDPAEALHEAGHGDLPGDLVAGALVSYADTADVGVAEHLAPFVMAATAGAQAPDVAQGLDLLASAPGPDVEVGESPAESEAPPLDFGAGADDLDFGSGAAAPDRQFVDEIPGEVEPERPFVDEIPGEVEPERPFVDEMPGEAPDLPESFGDGAEG